MVDQVKYQLFKMPLNQRAAMMHFKLLLNSPHPVSCVKLLWDQISLRAQLSPVAKLLYTEFS